MDEENLQASPQFTEPDLMPENIVDEKTAFDRFIEAITAPSEAFAGLGWSPRRKSIIVWGVVIGIIVNAVAVVLVNSSPGFLESIKEKQLKPLEKMDESGKLKKEDYDKAVERIESMDQQSVIVWQIPYVVLMLPVWWIIASAVLYGICRAVGPPNEESINYLTAWSAYMIALIVSHIETLLTAAGMYFTRNVDFSLSAGALLHTDNIFLATALRLVNPFTLWWIAVVGIGIAVIGRASRGKAIGIWAAFWIILNLVIGAVNQLFTGMLAR
jgi:hypothetical protein